MRSRTIDTFEDLIRAVDDIPLKEGRYAEVAIDVMGGRVFISQLTVDTDGVLLIVPSISVERAGC